MLFEEDWRVMCPSKPGCSIEHASGINRFTLISGEATDGLSRKVRPAPKEMEAMTGRGPSNVILSEGEHSDNVSRV